jgi:hypothetical protein
LGGKLITVICFSKDRPLQLHAYLESLMHYSNMRPENICVLYKDSDVIPYESITHNFPSVVWLSEKNFFVDLMRLLDDAGDYVLWGCDDVVFKGHFDLEQIERCFADPRLLCASLRYGRNLMGWDAGLSLATIRQDGNIMVFDRNIISAYPWDVSAAAYRKVDILEALNFNIVMDARARSVKGQELPTYPPNTVVPVSELITGPNKLEWLVYNWVGFEKLPHMACYECSRSFSFSVNRVQDVADNVYDRVGGLGEYVLYQAYLAGKRLDWHSLVGWDNKHTHEMSERFSLI